MKRASWFACVLASFPLAVAAGEGEELAARSKSLAAAAADAAAAKPAQAPFRIARPAPPEFAWQAPVTARGPRGACEATASDLCYDALEGRIVYRPARRLLPAVEGLTPESLAVRRDRIVLRYSFR